MLLLAGCTASTVPELVRTDGADVPTVEQAQQQPEALRERPVRWGGEILAVNNLADSTEVVVLRRELFSGGEPKPEAGEGRRFVARLPGFVDPAGLAPKTRITVVGRLAGNSVRKVGEYAYPHPVVQVQQWHHWGEYQPPTLPRWHTDPFYCDPLWPWGYPWPHPCW